MSAVMASDCRIPRLLQYRIKAVTASLSVINKSFKNKDTWVQDIMVFKIPNEIQP